MSSASRVGVLRFGGLDSILLTTASAKRPVELVEASIQPQCHLALSDLLQRLRAHGDARHDLPSYTARQARFTLAGEIPKCSAVV